MTLHCTHVSSRECTKLTCKIRRRGRQWTELLQMSGSDLVSHSLQQSQSFAAQSWGLRWEEKKAEPGGGWDRDIDRKLIYIAEDVALCSKRYINIGMAREHKGLCYNITSASYFDRVNHHSNLPVTPLWEPQIKQSKPTSKLVKKVLRELDSEENGYVQNRVAWFVSRRLLWVCQNVVSIWKIIDVNKMSQFYYFTPKKCRIIFNPAPVHKMTNQNIGF